jgi:hypothetical protein
MGFGLFLQRPFGKAQGIASLVNIVESALHDVTEFRIDDSHI